MNRKVYNFIRCLPFPREHRRLEWIKHLLNREYQRKIRQAGNNYKLIEDIRSDRNLDLREIADEQEMLYTESLLKKARRLRVRIPPQPRLIDGELPPNEDWEDTNYGICLTDKGITKIREEIRTELKWRRESWAFLMQWLTVIGGIIGMITGLVSVLRK